ncbi:MAG: hypothetical protein SFZ03_08935 [Candidatus Melainabacteria bacterium]|nr:hypothetical protein [Candidatus Melainabacteria bacterium]
MKRDLVLTANVLNRFLQERNPLWLFVQALQGWFTAVFNIRSNVRALEHRRLVLERRLCYVEALVDNRTLHDYGHRLDLKR